MTPNKTFLFDVGKVLLDFDFESSLRTLFPDDEPGVDSRLARVLEPKDAFERGELSLDEYLDIALGILGPPTTRESFCEAWRNIFTPNPPMWDVVSRLKADGHRLLLFSNTNAIHCPWFIENFEVFSAFEGGTYSFKAGSMKPDPGIYQSAITEHQLIPGETLYIDDLPGNIETGRSLGFRSHQYDLADHPAFERWLDEEMTR
jgi:putative hydrolase of the HAD superfamily